MPLTCTLISSFQPLLPESRPMISHHVTCHVTAVTCLFIVKEKKRNIKSRKIDKRRERYLVSRHTIISLVFNGNTPILVPILISDFIYLSKVVTTWQYYKLKNLELFKRKNLILGLIQENLIENSIQDHLPYIPKTNGPCSTTLAYPKWLCVYLKVNMCYIYYMILFFLESFTAFHCIMWSCNIVTVTNLWLWHVTSH